MNFAKMLLLLTLSTSVLAGCRSDDEEPRRSSGKTLPGTGTAGTNGVLLVDLTAASVTGTVNQPVELTAQGWLDSAKTTPVTAGTAITFARVNANGSLSDNSILADSLGQAKVTVSSSAPGSVTTTATIESVDSNAVVVAFQTAVGGGGGGGGSGTGTVSLLVTSDKDVLTIYDDNILNAGDFATLTFTVLVDATPSAGTLVRLSASSGSLSSNILTTNASGIVTVGYTAGLLAEDAVITATAAGQTATYEIIILPGVPATIEVETPSPDILGLQGSGSPENSVVSFTVRDRYGNLVSDSNVVSLALSPLLTGATVTPTSMTTNKGKISPVVHAGSQYGTMQLVATVGGVSVTSGNITVKNDAVSLVVDTLEVALNKTSLTVFDGNSGNTGDQVTVVVTVRDQNGAVMAGVPVKLSSPSGSFSSNLITTDITGTVTATFTAGSAAEDAVITATSGGKTGVGEITILPGEPFFVEAGVPSLTDLGFTGTGSPESSVVSFTVRDQYGNLVSDSTIVTLTLSTPVAGVTITPSSMTTNQGLVSTIVHSGSTAGTFRVIATVTAVGSPTALSNEIRISGGNVSTISVIANKPSVTVYDDVALNTGDQASVSVTVLNQYGAAMPGVSVSLSASSGSLDSNLLTTDGAGMVTVTYTAGTASGIANISASASGQSSSASLPIIAGTPTSIEVAAPSPALLGLQGTGSAESSVVRFTVRDQYGNLASNTTVVDLALVPVLAGATVAPTSMVTNNGVISAVVHTGTAIGSMRVVATVSGSSVTVTSGGISVVGGVVSSTSVVPGASFVTVYDGLPGGTDETSVNVTILDEFGNPLPGVTVELNTSGGLLSSELEITDAFGAASVTFTAGIVAEDVVITAVANGMTSIATISVLPGDPFVVEVGSPTPAVLGLDGSGLPRNSVVAVTVRDQYGNLVADGAEVTFALSPVLAGSTVSPVSLTTNGGMVSPVVHAGTASGNMQIVATVTGFGNPSATSNNITIFEEIAETTSLTVVSSKTTVTVFDEVALNLGDTADITVTVLDQFGDPVPAGVAVSLSATSGNLSATNQNTDAFGAVTVTYTAGTASGDVVISASADGIAGATSIAVLPGVPTVISVSAPTRSELGLQGSGAPETSVLTFTVRDRYGNLASDNTVVSFALSPALAGATVSPASMGLNSGAISPVVQSGTATGAMRVVATVNATTVTVSSGVITVVGGVVSSVAVVPASSSVDIYDGIPAGTDETTVAVTVRDQYGNPMAGVEVQLSSSSGLLSSDLEVTDALGMVSVTFTAGIIADDVVISAVAGGVANEATITVLPGDPFIVSMGSPAPASLGLDGSGLPRSSIVNVTVRDTYGNLVTDGTYVSFSLTPVLAGASVAPASLATNNGVVSPLIYAGTVGGTMNLVATVVGFGNPSAQSNDITILEDTSEITSITVASSKTSVTVFDDGAPTTNDQATITVTVVDQFGGTVGAGIPVALSATSGNLSATLVDTDAFGQVSATYTAGTVAGNIVITATTAGLEGSTSIAVIPGTPTVISVGAPSLSTLGVQGSGSPEISVLTFTVKDAYGNLASDQTIVDFVLSPALAGATVSPSSMNTNGGVISPIVQAGTVLGTMRVVATVNGTGVTVTSGVITVAGGAVNTVSVVPGASFIDVYDGAPAGTDETGVVVTVIDQYGSPMPGVSVQLSSSSGLLSSDLEVTDVLGQVSVTFTAGIVAGDVVITAVANGMNNVATITVLPGDPFIVSMSSPVPATLGLDGSGLPRSSTVNVTVRDTFGNLVTDGTYVSFSLTPVLAGASVAPASLATNNGVVSPLIYAGTVGGTMNLVATVVGFGNPSAQSNDITVLEDLSEITSITVASSKTSVTVFDNGAPGSADQAAITVTVLDQFGGTVGAGIPVSLSASSGNLSATLVNTDAFGQVNVTYTAGTVAGDVLISATTEGIVGSTSLPVIPGTPTVISVSLPSLTNLGLQGSGGPETSVLTFTVKDAYGNLASNSTIVDFVLTPVLAGATVSPTSMNTNSGVISPVVQAGTATGTMRVVATVNGTGVTVTSGAITVGGGVVSSVSVVAGASVIDVSDGAPAGSDETTVQVTVLDQNGNPLSGIPVQLNTSSGLLSSNLEVTNILGVVSVNYAAGIVAGDVVITAVADGMNNVATITVLPGDPFVVEMGTPAPATLGLDGSGLPRNSVVNVTVRDAYGNLVTDGTYVTFALTPVLAGATVAPVSLATNNGVASPVIHAGTAGGTMNLVATVTGFGSPSGMSSDITIVEDIAEVTSLTVASSKTSVTVFDNGAPGSADQAAITVTVLDQFGGTVGAGTPVALSASSGNLSATLVNTDAFGQVIVTYTAGTVAGDVLISATTEGIVGSTSLPVIPGTPTVISVSLPSLTNLGLQGSGAPETSVLTFTVKDAYGNLASNSTLVDFVLTPVLAGATVSPSSMNTNGGVISPVVQAGTATGTMRVVATVNGTGVTVTSGAITVGGGVVSSVSVVAGASFIDVYDGAPAGSDETTVQVTVLDQNGNPLSGIPVQLSSSSGLLSSNLEVTNILGVVSVTFAAGIVAEDVVITAVADGMNNVATITVLPGDPFVVEMGSPAPATLGLDGSGLPRSSIVNVTVRDAYGNLVSDGTYVTFNLTPVLAGANVQPASLATNNGVVSPVIYAGTAGGTMNLVATVTGFGSPSAQSSDITVLEDLSEITSLTVASSKTSVTVFDNGAPGSADQAAITVTVLDQFGGTVGAGTPVALSASSGNLSATLVNTDAFGQVIVTYTAGTVAGDVLISATTEGIVGSTSLPVIPGTPTVISVGAPSLSTLGVQGSGSPEISVLTFTVKDAYGNLASDQTIVDFVLSPALAGVTVSPSSMNTNNGVISPVVQAGTALGTMRVVATVNGTGVTVTSGVITVAGGAVNTVSVVPGASFVDVYDGAPAGTDETSVLVTVIDQYGSPMPGVSVQLSSSSGLLSSDLEVTDVLGQVSVTFTAGIVAGDVVITAVANGMNNVATITVLPGDPFIVSMSSPVPATLGLDGSGLPRSSTVNVTVRDIFGNLVTDGTYVSFSLTPVLAGASVAPASLATNNGVVSPLIYAGTAGGTMNLVATVVGFGNPSAQSSDITILEDVAEITSLTVASSKTSVTVFDDGAPGSADQAAITVTVLDQFGGTVGAGTPVVLSASSGNLSETLVNTDAFGQVVVTYTAGTVAGDVLISATTEGVVGSTSLPVIPGTPTVISVSLPSLTNLGLQGSGAPETSVLTFTVKDAYGNLASNSTLVDFVLTPVLAGATISPSSMNTNSGVISPVVQAGTATGTMRVVATVNGTGVTVTSGAITVGGGVVSSVSVVAGASVIDVSDGAPAGSDETTVQVTVLDQNGNPLSGIPVQLSSSSGLLSSNLEVTNILGVVSVNYAAGIVAGDVVITAVADGMNNVATITVLPGDPFVVEMGSPSQATLGLDGSGLPRNSVVNVTVRDAYGNLVTDGTYVTFALTPVLAGATVAPVSLATNNGVASPVIHAGTAGGTMNLVATVTGFGSPSAQSTDITVVEDIAVVTSLTVASSKTSVTVFDNGAPGTTDQAAITVTVLDQFGGTVGAGIPVALSATSGNLSATLVDTDAFGQVVVTYTAGILAGNVSISATAEGIVGSASLPVIPGTPTVISVSSPSLTNLGLQGSGAPETTVLTFTVRDAYGNLASDSTIVDFVLSPALAGATVSPSSMNTNAGVIAPTVQAGSALGTMRVVATVNGSAVTVSSGLISISDGVASSVSVTAFEPNVTVFDTLSIDDQSSITVTVLDDNGYPVSGAPVIFTASSGNLSSDLETTDINGQASVTYIAGTIAGDAIITVTVDGVTDFVSLPVLPGAPTVISVGAPSLTVLGLKASGSPETSVLTFTVRDQYGNLASNGTVLDFTLVPVLAGATVSPASMNINAGQLSPIVQSGTATGTMRVVATVSGGSVSVTSGGITVAGGVASSIAVTSSSSQVSVYDGIPLGTDEAVVTATVLDQYGNPLPNVSVQLSSSGGNLSSNLVLTDAFGVVAVTFVGGITSEDVVITAVADGLTDGTTIRVLPGDPFVVEVGAPAPSLLGLDGSGLPRSSVVAVTVRDQYGNLVANNTVVSFSLTPVLTGATVSPLSLTTFNGMASPVVHAGSVAGSMQLVATVTGFGNPSAMSSGITIFEEAFEVSSLSVTADTTTVTVFDNVALDTGDQATISVTVRDQAGSAVGAGVPVILSATSGNLSSSIVNTSGAGTVTVTYTAGMVAGVATITATAEGVAGTTSVIVLPGEAYVINLGTPTPNVLGLTGSGDPEVSVIDVTVKDQYGNLVSDNTVISYILAPALAGASVSPTTITTEQGLSTAFVHTGTVSGSMRLIASVAGKSVISSEITVVGAPASQVGSVEVSSTISSITVNDGDALNDSDEATIIVTVKDRDGALMAGQDVQLTTSAGSLTDSTLTTDGTGTFSVTYTAGIVAEEVTITATAGGVQGTFTLVVGPGAPFIIEVGDPTPAQLGIKGSGSPESSVLQITITDQSGNPVSDSTTVTFRLEPPLGGATVSPVTATTHTGLISAVVNSGTLPGSVRLVATVDGHSVTSGKITIFGGLPSADRFWLVVEPGKGVLPGYTTAGITATMTVFMTDRFGNPPQAGTSVYVACEAGRCGANNTVGIQTDETGVATFEIATAFTERIYVNPVSFPSAKQSFGGFVGISHTYPNLGNPKNGEVTILAMAIGESGFVDLNGNNVFDAGIDDITYEDVNNNGVFDLGIDTVTGEPDEPWLDKNSDGLYDSFEDFWDFDLDNNWTDHQAAPDYHAQQYVWDELRVIYSTEPNLQWVPQQFIDRNGDGFFDEGTDLPAFGGPAPTATTITNRWGGAAILQPSGSYVTTGTSVVVSFTDNNNNPLPKTSTLALSAFEGLTVGAVSPAALTYGSDNGVARAPVNFQVSETEADRAIPNDTEGLICAEITVLTSSYVHCQNGVRF